MKIKPEWLVTILLAVALCAPALRAQAPVVAAPASAPAAPEFSAEDEAEARSALGERFCDMAVSLAKATRGSREGMRQSETLLEAAVKMNPVEPRFMRLLGAWLEQMGDTNGAIAVWGKYHALLPDDRVAEAKLIDLYLTRLQSNDAKLKYIQDLLDKPTLDDQVKAHIAAKAVPLLDQRSRGEAMKMLARAHGYYPLPEVTLMELNMLPENAPAMQRFKAMMAVLVANPTNTDAIAGVAGMLAENGLSERALTWYAFLLTTHQANETDADNITIIKYLAERYRAGETTLANDGLDKILQKYPEFGEAWFLRLTTQRSDESIQMLHQAQQMFEKSLSDRCDFILKLPLPPGVTPSHGVHITAVPPTAPVPSDQVQAAIARARQLNDPRIIEALVDSLVDEVWFELYFDHKADAATPGLIAIKELRPATNFLVRRLDGWWDLVSGNEAAARAIFTAEQAHDPLCALGLFRLEDAKNHTNEANAIGAKMLSEPHTGTLAAIIYQATKGRGIKPASQPPDAAEMRAELDKFPKDFLDIINAPRKYYSLRVEPTKVGHKLGESMLALITIQNEAKEDLCIGDQGLIRPMLVFDGQIRGVNAQTFPAVAIDRIMGRFVLHPGESVSQVVRIDQAGLSEALRARPAVLLLLNADVVTNARIDNNGVVRALAGGYVQNFGRMFTRNPMPLAMDAQRRKLFADLANGSPEAKILDIELLAAYYNQYVQPHATPLEETLAQQFINFIDKSRSDPAPGVKVWASYVYAVLSTGADERRVLLEMMQSNSWESRLFALHGCVNLPPASVRELATASSKDKDPLVSTYAKGLLEIIQNAATQPATTAPATGPAPIAPATSKPAVPSPTTQPTTTGTK